ncbi:hypothetical protein RI543_000560 [Arxiozyma heterogenica]|uniref:Uncharacterized protein n=1 Tax=Arxiozyma heterogenica TaxID=278026 RepID=A0AAN7W5X2_9SACH|nr:hypothetical protein RI543_000560 [Kazachstania heterogenica]
MSTAAISTIRNSNRIRHTATTSFFDSSYQLYKKRQNQTQKKTTRDHTNYTTYRLNNNNGSKNNNRRSRHYPNLHPIISANTNYIEHPTNNFHTLNHSNPQINLNNTTSTTNTTTTTTTTTNNNNNNNNNNNSNVLNDFPLNFNNRTNNISLFNDVYNTVSFNGNANNSNSTNNINAGNLSQSPTTINNKRNILTTQYSSPRKLTEADIKDDKCPWDEDLENNLNSDTYLKIHCEQINKCFQLGQYNKINSLYQSLRRNDLVPSIDIYEKIFISFHKRSFDQNNQNLNEKMWQLLNCYQDMINNKLKPNSKIYNILLLQIFKNSIIAIETNNMNGLDFFKIGSELLTTITQKNKISNETINYYLLSMNLYARETIMRMKSHNKGNNNNIASVDTSSIIPDLTCLKNNLIELSSIVYEKDSFYFLNFISLANLKKDLIMLKSLYNEFLFLLPMEKSISLKENQFEIYSMFITAFIETGELTVGSKMFNNIINEIKKKNGSKKIVTMVLSNFIISLSKVDPQRAYSVWFEFKKLSWVPEFSYEFYLLLLSNCFHDWDLTTKIYNYIYPMERSFNSKNKFQINKFRLNSNTNLSTYLLYPIHTENVINLLLDYALQLRDSDIIMKLLEESMVKNFKFDSNLYPFIFKFLKELNAPVDYLIRFIEIHGSLHPNLPFLSSITNSCTSPDLLLKIYNMHFFQEICSKLNFSLNSINQAPFDGLVSIMSVVWNSSHPIESYPHLLKIHAIIVIRLFDFDTLDPTMIHDIEMSQQPGMNNTRQMDQFILFKEKIIDCFTKFVKNYKGFNLDPSKIDPVVPQAAKFIIDLKQEYVDYFAHPGDWDKNYPLSLGPAIRNSTKTGLKEYENLSSKGYCFDYDTFKELIKHKYYDQSIINNFLGFSQDDIDELRFSRNLLISKMKAEDIELMVLLNGPNFQKQVLPYLNEVSLIRTMKSLVTIGMDTFLRLINFPYGFKHITKQAEYKRLIEFIYTQLFEEGYYDLILELNETCPVLDVEILLESCIRSSNPINNNKFIPLFAKFQNSPLLLTESQRIRIESEYLIIKGHIKEAADLLEMNIGNKDEDLINLYSFTVFIQSFYSNITQFKYTPKNTIQLANMLSACSSFISVVNNYDHWNMRSSQEECTKEEILGQMLQNLIDASRLFQREKALTDDIKKILNEKLRTLYRFKVYLRSPHVTITELQQLIHIWQVINPSSVIHLFNNIVETVYLNQDILAETGTLTLQGNLVWEFDIDSLVSILEDVSVSFTKDEENMSRLNEFRDYIYQRYPMPIDAVVI